MELGFHVADGVRQRKRVLLRGAQDMERQALRRLSADARQLASSSISWVRGCANRDTNFPSLMEVES